MIPGEQLALFLQRCIDQIFLRDNPLLEAPLKVEHTKIRLLGLWGSDPGLSLIYIRLNRLIKKHDLNMILLAGPGHGDRSVQYRHGCDRSRPLPESCWHHAKERLRNEQIACCNYAYSHGIDKPEILGWKWPF